MDSGFLLFFILVGVVSCHHQSHHGWKTGVQYEYEMRGRNVVGLHQVDNQFVGLLTRGVVHIQARSNGRVNVKMHQAEQMDLHANLSRGWRTFVPDEGSNYSPFPIQTNTFDLEFKGGVVEKMWIQKAAPVHEVNILKAIASLLQTDTTGVNLKKSSLYYRAAPEDPRTNFMTMEDTVNGEVETEYNISPLPEHHLQSEPSLARVLEACPDFNTLLSVDKILNFSKPHHLPVYNYGFDDLPNGIVGGNAMGNMLSRASTTRSVICGTLENFLVQSAVTTDKIVVAPHLYNEQKGIVAAQFNLTLIQAGESKGEPTPLPSDAQEYASLQYSYNPAGSSEEARSSRSKRSAKQEPSRKNDLGHRNDQNDFEDEAKSVKKSKSDKDHENSQENNSSEKPKEKHNSGKSYGSGMGKNDGGSQSYHKTKSSGRSTPSSSSDSDSSSSSVISSEKKYWQPRPSLKSAPNSPLLPLFIGFSGNSIQAASKGNGVEMAQKLAAYVGRSLAQRNSRNPQQTLAAFSRLVSVLQTMNEEQMRQTTGKVHFEYSKASQSSQDDANKYAAWVALRDAIAQAGTGPALLTIQNFMKTNMAKGEEAAGLLATSAKMAQYPSEEFVESFFNTMKSEEVARHSYVNISAVMSFAGLVRRVFVSNETTFKQYPVHSFGLPHSSKSQVVRNKYIPHFKSKLEEAIRNGDSPSIQLYIWALGETAHPSVLDILEPYLQGSSPSSAFQRLTMIASLSEMARVYPKYVRPTMFKIYQNTAEKPEVRVASIMQLMKTNPPPQLLQRIAQFTNWETSKQVNSAVKSAIESAARDLQMSEDHELAESARSAVDTLTKYEYGSQYSKVFLSSWEKQNVHLGYLHELSHIQSEDSVFPSSFFCTMKRRLGGFENRASKMSMSTSSLSNLLSLISSQMAQRTSSQGSSSNEGGWSHEKIEKLLNIAKFVEEQVEGNVMATVFGTKHIFAFDNHTINRLPQYVRETVDNLRTPKPFNMTKMYDQLNLKIAFPTATGLPFSYVFSVPTVIEIGGQVEGKIYPDPSRVTGPMPLPRTANITGDVNVMYSAMSEGKMSIITPFNHKEYSSGLRRNIQIRLPIQFHADVDLDNTKVRWTAGPLEPKKVTKVFEYSTVPYTSINNLLDLVEPSSKEQTINVRKTKKVYTPVNIMGMALDVGMETQQEYLSWSNVYYAVRNHNFMTALTYPFAEEAINHNNFTLVYNGPKSSTTRVMGALKYNSREGGNDIPFASSKPDKTSRRPGTGYSKAAMDTIDTGFDSPEREMQILSMAASGIKDATSRIVDLSLIWEGSGQRKLITAAVAVGSSSVSNSSLIVAFSSCGSQDSTKASYKVGRQVYAVANVTSPLLHVINFKKTLEEETKMTVNASVHFGDKENMATLNLKMSMSKSEERRQALKKKPLTRVCIDQMNKNYWVQPSCRNVTGQSGHMDSYTLTMNYENVPAPMKTATWIAYTIGRYYVTDYMSEQLVGEGAAKSGRSGRLAVEWKIASKALNISVVSPAIEANFTNVPMNPTVAKAFTIHPTYSVVSRVASKLTRHQFFPICAVEGSSVSTFDNQTYPSDLKNCWYAMAHSVSKVFQDSTILHPSNYSVLVRKISSDNKKEVMMVLDDNVILLQPNQSLSWNGKSTLISNNRMDKFWDSNKNEVATAYLLPGNLIVVESPRYHMQVLYDGFRVLLQLSNSQRGSVRGLCGNFNGEKIDDFLTPHDCVQASPETFVSHYAVPSGSCKMPSDGTSRGRTNTFAHSEYNCVPRDVFKGRPIEEEAGSYVKSQTATHRRQEHSISKSL